MALSHYNIFLFLVPFANVRPETLTPENLVTKIKGNRDGPGGRNETYTIGSRKEVTRQQAVKEVEAGKHPDAHTVKVNGQKYVRDNPDGSKKDNVNR